MNRAHRTVCHSPTNREWARDDDGDGIREVHTNTMEGIWTGLRSFPPTLQRYIKNITSPNMCLSFSSNTISNMSLLLSSALCLELPRPAPLSPHEPKRIPSQSLAASVANAGPISWTGHASTSGTPVTRPIPSRCCVWNEFDMSTFTTRSPSRSGTTPSERAVPECELWLRSESAQQWLARSRSRMVPESNGAGTF